jgi:hypothetical protein
MKEFSKVELSGRVNVKNFLQSKIGHPTVLLNFQTGLSSWDNCILHEIGKLNPADNTITMTPPIGEFTLLRYFTEPVFQLPLKLTTAVEETRTDHVLFFMKVELKFEKGTHLLNNNNNNNNNRRHSMFQQEILLRKWCFEFQLPHI